MKFKPEGYYKGIFNYVSRTWKEHGITGYFRGTFASVFNSLSVFFTQ